MGHFDQAVHLGEGVFDGGAGNKASAVGEIYGRGLQKSNDGGIIILHPDA